MNNQNGGKNSLDGIGAIIAIVMAILFAIATFCSSSEKRDVVHDPDGFLGYSDSFWEWQMKQ